MNGDRLRVLFLTHRLPYAPNRGDRTRAYHILQFLVSKADVSLISLVHDPEEASQVDDMRRIVPQTIIAPVPKVANIIKAALALPSTKPLTNVLLESPTIRGAFRRLVATAPPDVVLAYCSSMTHFALEPPLDGFPLVIDMVDADSAKWQALAATRAWPINWLYRRESRTLGMFEAQAMRKAHATVAVNDREVELLKQLAPDARVEVMGIGVDLAHFRPPHPPAASRRVVFSGVMNYEPNESGAIWLIKSVWPRVREAVPDAALRIVGASPTRRLRSLQSESQAIVVTGTLPDIRPELWAAAVGVAPLHTSRGVQNKVLEAVAAGLPCVITSPVRVGLPAEILPACDTADRDDAFAQAIVRVLRQSPGERRARASVDISALSWERRLEPLLPLLTEAAARS